MKFHFWWGNNFMGESLCLTFSAPGSEGLDDNWNMGLLIQPQF